MRKAKAKFVQLVTSVTSISALDSSGKVWTYLGNNYGWRPMNMTKLTFVEAIEAAQEKYSPRVLDEEGE